MKRDFFAKLGLTAEILEKVGLDKDVIDKIMAENGSDIEAAKKSAGSRVTELETQVTDLAKQLNDANAKIETFKDMKSPQDVEAAVNDWKVKVAEAEKNYKETVAGLKRDHALERELKETYKVKNVKAVSALLKIEDLKFNEKDETFIGLKEQVEPLSKSDAYLFNSDKVLPRFVSNGKSEGGDKPETFGDAISERLQSQKQ